MDNLATPDGAASKAAATAGLTRRQIVAVALLTCGPLPLFSLVATVGPLPDLVERVAARLVPFAQGTLGGDEGRVIRERAALAGSLDDLLDSPTGRAATSAAPDTTRADQGGVQAGVRPNRSSPETGTTGETGEEVSPDMPRDDSPPAEPPGADPPTVPSPEGPGPENPPSGDNSDTDPLEPSPSSPVPPLPPTPPLPPAEDLLPEPPPIPADPLPPLPLGP